MFGWLDVGWVWSWSWRWGWGWGELGLDMDLGLELGLGELGFRVGIRIGKSLSCGWWRRIGVGVAKCQGLELGLGLGSVGKSWD